MALRSQGVGYRGPQGPKGDKGDVGSQGAPGLQGVAGPAGAVGATGPVGQVGQTGPVGAKGDTGPIGLQGPSGAQGPQGVAGATGPAGTPKRVERYTATTNASGIATFTFPTPFSAAPDVDVIQGWIGDQEVGGAPSNITTSGCSVLVKVSRATLLLSAGPYQTAGSGVSVTIRCIGN